MTSNNYQYHCSPQWFVTDAMQFIPVSGVVGEPCAGNGVISEVLKLYDRVTNVWTNDLDPSWDDADYHLDATEEESWKMFPAADWIVTNPPYSGLDFLILEKANRYARRGVLMFLRHSFTEPCQNRANWLDENPQSHELVYPRYRFKENKYGRLGNDSATVTAYAWDKKAVSQLCRSRPAKKIAGFHSSPKNAPDWETVKEIVEQQQKRISFKLIA